MAALRAVDRVLPALDARQDIGRGAAGGAPRVCLVEAGFGGRAGSGAGGAVLPDFHRAGHRDDLVSARPGHRAGDDYRPSVLRKRCAVDQGAAVATGDRRDVHPVLSSADHLAGEPAADLHPLGDRPAQDLATPTDSRDPRGGLVVLAKPLHLGPARDLRPRLLSADGGSRAGLHHDLLHADHLGGGPLHLPADDRRDRADRRRRCHLVSPPGLVRAARADGGDGRHPGLTDLDLVQPGEYLGQRGRTLDAHAAAQRERLAGPQPAGSQEVCPRPCR